MRKDIQGHGSGSGSDPLKPQRHHKVYGYKKMTFARPSKVVYMPFRFKATDTDLNY